ncbi:MAG: hypothetical protein WC208_14990 [Gallionella sp.]|jgi:hypothetical protein
MRVFETMGSMGSTARIATTDTAAGITSTLLYDTTTSRRATAATISIETNNVRIAFTATPTQGASGLGHLLYPGDSWRIVGRENLEDFLIISAANGVAGAYQITVEY